MGKVTWPESDLISKCVDVYSLIRNKEEKKWMMYHDLTNSNNDIVLVEEVEPDIIPTYTKRLFVCFNGPDLQIADQEDSSSLINTISLYCNKNESFIGFQEKAEKSLKLFIDRLIKLQLFENTTSVLYEIVFCGYGVGGAIAATAFSAIKTICNEHKKQESLMTLKDSVCNSDHHSALTSNQLKHLKESLHLYRCITHGAPSFGNKSNKDYCEKSNISRFIFNVINEKDPIPLLFYNAPKQFSDFRGGNAIGNFRILEKVDINGLIAHDINYDASEKVEIILMARQFDSKDMIFHKLDKYQQPYNYDAYDKMDRVKKDLKQLGKPYIPLKIIGQGSYGIVIKALHVPDKREVAIKKLKITKEFQNNIETVNSKGKTITLNNEIDNLRKFDNKHVLRFYEYFVFDKKKLYLVFELCTYGSLNHFVSNHLKPSLKDEIALRNFSKQLFNGLAAIHKQDIIHRDLKPANILVTSDQNGEPCYKIGDLGSSLQYHGRSNLLSVEGTVLYMSPELYKAKTQHAETASIDPRTDIFSLGAVILFCLKQEDPWSQAEYVEIIKERKAIGFENRSELKNVSNALRVMISDMLKIGKHERPFAKSLKQHPFIQEEEVNMDRAAGSGLQREYIDKHDISSSKTTNGVTKQTSLECDCTDEYLEIFSNFNTGNDHLNDGFFEHALSKFTVLEDQIKFIKQHDKDEKKFMEMALKYRPCEEIHQTFFSGGQPIKLDCYLGMSFYLSARCYIELRNYELATNAANTSLNLFKPYNKPGRGLSNIILVSMLLADCCKLNGKYDKAIAINNECIINIALDEGIQHFRGFKELIHSLDLKHMLVLVRNTSNVKQEDKVKWSPMLCGVFESISECYGLQGNRKKRTTFEQAMHRIMFEECKK